MMRSDSWLLRLGWLVRSARLLKSSAWRGSLHSKTEGALFGMTLMASSLIPGLAHAQLFVCTCAAPSCGNGVTPGSQDQVYHGVPALSLERMFAPTRTGAAKTGWECVTAADYKPAAKRRGEATQPEAALPPQLDPKSSYVCTCQRPRCGGSGIMPGEEKERHGSLAAGFVSARFQPGSATGWQCQNGLGEAFVESPKAPPPAPPAPPAIDPNLRYACTCSLSTCGGKDGITEAERGQRHSGISAARVASRYAPERSGDSATGWTCKPDGPAPKFSCTCNRELCGGKDGITEGERTQKHSGVSLSRVPTSYGPERTGDSATGWTCSEEGRAAPAIAQVANPPGVAAAPAQDAGYICRCEGLLGCGSGGAPYGKKGEVRRGVPANLIDDLYHSDVPGAWVCSVAPGTVAMSIRGLLESGYTCRCEGILGCGSGGAVYGTKGEVRQGVPAVHIKSRYRADVPGGWACTVQ